MNLAEKLLSRCKVNEQKFYAGMNCIEWQRSTTVAGYGKLWVGSKLWLTHRLSYVLFRDSFIKSLNVLHKCDNRKCCNPAHLFLGTQKDNMQDATKKDRLSHGELRYGAKLTAEQVKEIRIAASNYVPQEILVAKYGVIQQTISAIICGKKWKRAGGPIRVPYKRPPVLFTEDI